PPNPPAMITDKPIEIVFGTGNCSSYKYIYTTTRRILRAKTDQANFCRDVALSEAQQTCSDPTHTFAGIPNLPPDTTAIVGSFAIADQPARLFYGYYNNHQYQGTGHCPPNALNPVNGGCPDNQAYIWTSIDCGDSWTTPATPQSF